MDKGKLKGHAALWVANLVWGLNAPIGKSVLWSESNPGGVSPFALSVYRMLGACLLFWSVSFFLPRERVARRDIVLLLFASVFGIQLNQMLFLWGLSLTSPIDSSIIATVVPVLTMVLATLFLREPITWLKAGGVFLGCAGALILILVSQHGTGHSSSVMGDVLCIVSAVSYATYLTAFRNVIVRYSPVTTMKWMFLFAAIVAVVIYYRPLTAVDYAGLAPRTWAGIGYVVVCSTFLSYLMVPIGQHHLRQRLAVVPLRQLQQVIVPLPRVVKRLHRGRGRAQKQPRTLGGAAVFGHVAGVVAGRVFRLVRPFLLLVHNDQSQLVQRREHRRPGTKHDVRLAPAQPLVLVVPLRQAQAAVQQRHLVSEIGGEARHHLRRQGDLRHQDHHGLAHPQQLLRQPDIHHRLAAAGNAPQQRDPRFTALYLPQQRVTDPLLPLIQC